MPNELGQLMGKVMADVEASHEAESWKPKHDTYYSVTITQAATAGRNHRVFGFNRKIRGHDEACCRKLKDGTILCRWSMSAISEEEALSLVKKGQGFIYKITEVTQRIK